MISQTQANELIKNWEAAYKKIKGLELETCLTREFNDAASILVWTIIQLKNAGYQLSESDSWYHFSAEN